MIPAIDGIECKQVCEILKILVEFVHRDDFYILRVESDLVIARPIRPNPLMPILIISTWLVMV